MELIRMAGPDGHRRRRGISGGGRARGGFTPACLSDNDEPERASRPFDAGRDGFVFAEGAGVVIVESLERAQARGHGPPRSSAMPPLAFRAAS
jgi:hypothetical protein